jgi:GT2 family glycosyltransferase
MSTPQRLDERAGHAPAAAASISVVIAVRDGEDTIERALGSVLAQTAAPHEVLVVDDRSTDSTRDRVAAFGAAVELLSGEGRGVAAARNLAIRRATGTWVAFLDADDHWDPVLLELAARQIAGAPDAVACFCAATPVDDRGDAIGRHDIPEQVTLGALVRGHVRPTASATLVRRDATLRLGGFFEGFRCRAGVEDVDLWWRLAGTGPCVGVTRSVATYVIHDERDRGRSAALLAALEHDRNAVIERLAGRRDAEELLPRAGAVMRAGTARYWLRAGHARRARAASIESLRSLPTRDGVSTLVLACAPARLRAAAIAARRRLRARGDSRA